MEELPISAGMQIIDADLYTKGIQRIYKPIGRRFDSRQLIDEAFSKLDP
jgi:hypothetical protein